MSLPFRKRILSVYRGDTADVVPCMLDLSHWFYHRTGRPWDLSQAYVEPERELIHYHRKTDVGFYLPNLAAFWSVVYPPDVKATVQRSRSDPPEITWRLETPLGTIERVRRWEETNYAWGIRRWGIETDQDLRVLAYALGERRYEPHWDRYRAWMDEVGDLGVVYVGPGYSAMGLLLNAWMGIERTLFATGDRPAELRGTIRQQDRYPVSLFEGALYTRVQRRRAGADGLEAGQVLCGNVGIEHHLHPRRGHTADLGAKAQQVIVPAGHGKALQQNDALARQQWRQGGVKP